MIIPNKRLYLAALYCVCSCCFRLATSRPYFSSTNELLERTFRPRLHGSGQIFGRTNFVPGPPVVADAVRGKSNMAADKNFTWHDEEINLLLHVVIDYKAGNQGKT